MDPHIAEPVREPEPRLRQVFFGPEGLRAGWGCLVFLVLLTVLGMGLNLLAHWLFHGHSRPQGPLTPGLMIAAESIEAGLVLLVTWCMARLERRPFADYGLVAPRLLPRFGVGLLAGFAAISALVGILWAFHLLMLHGPVLPTREGLRFGLLWAIAFFLTGVFEETLLRGYLLFTLARSIGFPGSALLLSAAFGLIHGHNPGETPVGLFSAAAVGLVFCLSIWYTGSLWWAIGFHAAWDWGESFFWGTSDSGTLVQGHLFNEHPVGPMLWSGGPTGPEGSLLVFPMLLLVALLIVLSWKRPRSPFTSR